MNTVLLTRPPGENESLREQLFQRGLSVMVHPLIELSGKPVDAAIKKVVMDLDRYDKIIFVSKGSVRFGMPVLENYWPQWPINLQWFAVGRGTAETLGEFGVTASFPDKPGSEGLLALNGLRDVANQQILIVRGEGGRELLAQSLMASGATVSYLEIYRRQSIQHDFSELDSNVIVILTSAEIMDNFTAQAADKLPDCHAIVPSRRLQRLAEAMPFSQVTNAGGASDEALYDAVIQAANESGSAT